MRQKRNDLVILSILIAVFISKVHDYFKRHLRAPCTGSETRSVLVLGYMRAPIGRVETHGWSAHRHRAHGRKNRMLGVSTRYVIIYVRVLCTRNA